MGQEEVMKILRRSKKPLTSTEIAKLLRINERSVRKSLSKLKKDISVNLKIRSLSSKERRKKYGYNVGSPYLVVYNI